jgi:hypothetical protein
MQARKHRAAGMSEADAMARARLEFGNLELVKEDARDGRGARPLEDFLADVRYAIRGLVRAPVFSLSVILTIGIGVGLNTSVFTIFDAYVLRPFDIRDPYSVYSLQWLDRAGHVHEFAPRDVDRLRGPSSAVSDVAWYRTMSARIAMAPSTGDAVSENYFQMTGVRAALGRTLVIGDRYTPVVILSHEEWRNRFSGDSNVVGKAVSIHGTSFRVVGVAQEGFEGFFKKPRDFWISIDAQPRAPSASHIANESGDEQPVSVLVRLAPGVSAAQGRAFFASTLQNMTEVLPGRVFCACFLRRVRRQSHHRSERSSPSRRSWSRSP